LAQPVEAGWHNAFDGTFRWDAGWFVRIAEKGYNPLDGSAEFYPAFPMVSRAFAWLLPGGALVWATLVANVSFLLALIPCTDSRRSNTRRMSRGSFVFMAPYSESLFLLSSLAAFWWARRGRWGGAAIAGVVTTATRVVGLVLVPALLIEAVSEGDPARRGWRVIAAMVPVAGFIAYLTYWLIRSGPVRTPPRSGAVAAHDADPLRDGRTGDRAGGSRVR
jgi:Gpi18-like mannosyltransferase